MNTNAGERHPSYAGQLAVVTGASSGIGFALARQFAGAGFDLIIAAEDGTISDAQHALSVTGAAVEAYHADLATYQGVEALVAAIGGRDVDAVAINAGVGVGGEFPATDLKAELELIDLNCKSTVHLAKRMLNKMLARGSGRMLFTASIASLMPAPYEAVYGASKAFVYSFAEALRSEVKDTGVSITAMLPGPTDTNFFHRAGMDDTKAGQAQKDDPEDVARQGFDALMAGKDHVVAGSVKTKIQAAVIGVMPETVKGEFHKAQAAPGSATAKDRGLA